MSLLVPLRAPAAAASASQRGRRRRIEGSLLPGRIGRAGGECGRRVEAAPRGLRGERAGAELLRAATAAAAVALGRAVGLRKAEVARHWHPAGGAQGAAVGRRAPRERGQLGGGSRAFGAFVRRVVEAVGALFFDVLRERARSGLWRGLRWLRRGRRPGPEASKGAQVVVIEMELRKDEPGSELRPAVKSPSRTSLKNALKNMMGLDSDK